LFLFSPDKHCERHQDPAKDQTVGEVDGTVNFCDHIFILSFLISALHSMPLRTAQRRARTYDVNRAKNCPWEL
jgi:hypothetical protein